MNKILVLNGAGYANAVRGCGEISLSKEDFLKNPDQYKLILFTGGEDVNPAFYGHTSPERLCGYNSKRDIEEKKVFDLALANNIPMTGICRGAQFLNAMSGGTMMHHITNHGGKNHYITTKSNTEMHVTSTHHQMCVVSDDGFVVGYAKNNMSEVYCGDKDLRIDYVGPEVEAIYYPKTKVFAVQYHPEYMPVDSDGYTWFQEGVLDILTLTEQEFIKKYVITKSKSLGA